MAAVELVPGRRFDAGEFAAFLEKQPALGTKWPPRFVRITDDMPLTGTNKVVKAPLRAEAWECADPVWWRPGKDLNYRALTEDDRSLLRSDLQAHGARPQ